MEEVIAIVETNNCFSDGIQMTTGCSFANNALIYHDLGKTAVTVAKRDGEAVRVAVRADYSTSFDERYPEAHALFEKIVTTTRKGKRSGEREEPTPKEQARLSQLWAKTSYKQLGLPEEEIFTVERKRIDLPPYAPIVESAICAVCGESVMETKARLRDGEPAVGDERYRSGYPQRITVRGEVFAARWRPRCQPLHSDRRRVGCHRRILRQTWLRDDARSGCLSGRSPLPADGLPGRLPQAGLVNTYSYLLALWLGEDEPPGALPGVE